MICGISGISASDSRVNPAQCRLRPVERCRLSLVVAQGCGSGHESSDGPLVSAFSVGGHVDTCPDLCQYYGLIAHGEPARRLVMVVAAGRH